MTRPSTEDSASIAQEPQQDQAQATSASRRALWIAAACGGISSVGYTLANICLRSLTDVDPVWVSQIKTLPTIIGVAPFAIYRIVKGYPTIVNGRNLLLVVIAAVIGQVGGNIAFQWCLGIIGLALAVPITMGAMIVSGGLLGKLLLRDPISRPIAIASCVLMIAIMVLTLGSQQANSSLLPEAAEGDLLSVILGVAAAMCAGLAYSSLGVAIRYATNRGASITSVLLVVGIVGFLLLGGWVHSRFGFAIWRETTRSEYAFLAGAGIFNVIAFAALARSLQLSSLMFVNALNSTQIALAALAGVFLFSEPATWPLIAGILLTIVGLQLMRSHDEPASEPV